MIQLNIAVNSSKAKPAERPAKCSSRSANLQEPVKTVRLNWYEEQQVYDRMYEAEVWKNGHFFGYRSKVAQRWHTSDQAIEESKKSLSPAAAQKLHRLIRTLKQED